MRKRLRDYIQKILNNLSQITGDVINLRWILIQAWIHGFLLLGSTYIISLFSGFLLLKHSGLTNVYYALMLLVLYDCLRIIFWFKNMAEREFSPKIDETIFVNSQNNDDEWAEVIDETD